MSVVIIVFIFLSQLFNDLVSIETILCDNGMFNEYGATGAIKIGR
jgi:hypothetical protein